MQDLCLKLVACVVLQVKIPIQDELNFGSSDSFAMRDPTRLNYIRDLLIFLKMPDLPWQPLILKLPTLA